MSRVFRDCEQYRINKNNKIKKNWRDSYREEFREQRK